MRKRVLAVLLGAAVAMSGLATAPAPAQEAPPPEVPEVVQVEDPVGDANFINNDTANGVGNNNVTPADASSIGDLMSVWFSHDAEKLSVHVQTEAAPPGGNAVTYQVYAAPGEGPEGSNATGCLRFVILIPGTNPGGGSYQGPPFVKAHDRCNVGGHVFDSQDGEYEIATLADESGVTTATFPREYSPLFADGQVLAKVKATASSPTVGTYDHTGVTGQNPLTFVSPFTDNTDVGGDYTVTAGGDDGDGDKPNCKKGQKYNRKTDKCEKKKKDKKDRGKKTRKCKKNEKYNRKTKKCEKKKPDTPEPEKCPAYVPGEKGKDAKTTVVTDAATEEKPIEVSLNLPMGVGQATGNATVDAITTSRQSHAFHHVQVDSTNPEAGLFVRLASPFPDDNDLYLYHSTGKEAAHAAGYYGPVPGRPIYNSNQDGGHTDPDAEQLDGIRTADCYGYTVDAVAAISRGGSAVSLKLWLGEPSDYEVPGP